MKQTTTYGLYNILESNGTVTTEFGWLIRWQFTGTDKGIQRVARWKPTARQLRKETKIVRGMMRRALAEATPTD